MAKKFKAGDLVKREVWYKKDITEHSFKGDMFAIIIGTKDERDDVYHNLCMLLNKNLHTSDKLKEWFGKNFGYVLVDDSFRKNLSVIDGYTVEVTDEMKPTEEDIQLWEAAKDKRVDAAVYDEEE